MGQQEESVGCVGLDRVQWAVSTVLQAGFCWRGVAVIVLVQGILVTAGLRSAGFVHGVAGRGLQWFAGSDLQVKCRGLQAESVGRGLQGE